jgi:hypothetical protein
MQATSMRISPFLWVSSRLSGNAFGPDACAHLDGLVQWLVKIVHRLRSFLTRFTLVIVGYRLEDGDFQDVY